LQRHGAGSTLPETATPAQAMVPQPNGKEQIRRAGLTAGCNRVDGAAITSKMTPRRFAGRMASPTWAQ